MEKQTDVTPNVKILIEIIIVLIIICVGSLIAAVVFYFLIPNSDVYQTAFTVCMIIWVISFVAVVIAICCWTQIKSATYKA